MSGEFTKEERRAFAEEVRRLLTEQGGVDSTVAEGIMRSAGPGQAICAVNWLVQAVQVIDCRSIEPITPDVLNDTIACVLARFGAKWGLGDFRGLPVLQALGLPLPPTKGAFQFRRFMTGAKVAVRHGVLLNFLNLRARNGVTVCGTYYGCNDALCYWIKKPAEG